MHQTLDHQGKISFRQSRNPGWHHKDVCSWKGVLERVALMIAGYGQAQFHVPAAPVQITMRPSPLLLVDETEP